VLIALLDATGRDPSNWKVLQWTYNDVFYESADQLRDAMKSPTFQKNTLNLEGNWTGLEDFSAGLRDRNNPPPVMIQHTGSRFKVNEKQKFVTWMGFQFFITTSSDTGVALHDIKFNGDSVIYELSLQETFVTYASNDPKQGGQDFLDSGFLMGFAMVELVPGYDCPAYATFISTAYHVKGQTIPRKNCICIFEYTADHALQRHTSASQVSIGRNTYMVVRFVSTVGNYDYTFDYVFYLDGTIEVKIRASGFIFGVFWNENGPRDEYGYRIHDAAATAMHDHVLNFKADLDVVGTSNTMVKIGIEEIMKEFPWDDKESTPRNTMHLVPRAVEKETGINWAPNSGEILLVLNENATNAWGESRGYRIQPGSGIGTPAHRTVATSTSSGVAAEWATKDLWVVKQKDTEPKSSTAFNAFSPSNPLVNFKRFVDGEEIVDDDL
jgi:primary-amine oxidase